MILRASLVLAVVLALAACSDAPPPETADGAAQSAEPTPAPTTAPPTAALAPVTTLAGAWRVAGIDGAPLDGDMGIALTGDDKEIWWDPRCAGLSVRYRIEGTRFIQADTPVEGKSPPQGKSTAPVVCLIAIPVKAAEVMGALRAAERIERTPQNGILLSGGGRSLLLFSQ